ALPCACPPAEKAERKGGGGRLREERAPPGVRVHCGKEAAASRAGGRCTSGGGGGKSSRPLTALWSRVPSPASDRGTPPGPRGFPPASPSPARRPCRAGRPAWLPSPAPTGGRTALRRRGGEGWAGRQAGYDAELLRCPQLHPEEHARRAQSGRPGPTSASQAGSRAERGVGGGRSALPLTPALDRDGEAAASRGRAGVRGPRSTCSGGGSTQRAPPQT
ncbi:hypothetical protein P7K49_022347, partial [Saguinus oedipus]